MTWSHCFEDYLVVNFLKCCLTCPQVARESSVVDLSETERSLSAGVGSQRRTKGNACEQDGMLDTRNHLWLTTNVIAVDVFR